MRGMTAHDVYEDVDRHGNVRTYCWRGKGHRKVRIYENPGSEEFNKRYHELIRQSADGAFKPAPRDAPKPGTCFKQWDEHATQRATKLIVETMLLEPICRVNRFGVKHVRVLRDRKADRPGAANTQVRRLRTNWFRKRCLEAGLSQLSAHGLRKAAATRAAEKGATTSELMGIFGWRNISQSEISHAPLSARG